MATGRSSDESLAPAGQGGGQSIAQIEANRRKCIKLSSADPAGKAVSSRNTLLHRLRAPDGILPDEDPVAFREFASSLCEDLDPIGAFEWEFAQRIVELMWRLRGTNALNAACSCAAVMRPPALNRSPNGYSPPRWTRIDPQTRQRGAEGAAARATGKAAARRQYENARLAEAWAEGDFPSLSRYQCTLSGIAKKR